MTDSGSRHARPQRRTFLGLLIGGAAGVLALPSLLGRNIAQAVRPKTGRPTAVRTHPSAVARTSTKAHSHD